MKISNGFGVDDWTGSANVGSGMGSAFYRSSAMFAENFFIMCRSEWIPASRAYPVFYFRIGYGADEIGAVLAHGAGLAALCTESGLILCAGDEGSLSHDLIPFYIAFYGLLRCPLAR